MGSPSSCCRLSLRESSATFAERKATNPREWICLSAAYAISQPLRYCSLMIASASERPRALELAASQ